VINVVDFIPYFVGIIILCILFLIVKYIFNGSITKLAEGADKRLSLSKFQFLLWFIALLYSYIVVYIVRYQAGDVSPINQIPPNLLILTGASAGTMLAAKGITSSQVQNGSISKTPEDESKKTNLTNLVNDDDNISDLSKIQMLSWTFVAIGIYLISALPASVANYRDGLIDIDTSLMVLMGLSQGTYLGKKLISTTTPTLTGATPNFGVHDTEVILSGTNLGSSQNGSVVTFGSINIQSIEWSTTSIKVKVPNLKSGAIKISVTINGVTSNDIPFTVN
jgi:Leucine-rich repeat (LRR) protein